MNEQACDIVGRGRLLRFKKIADTLDCSTRTLFTKEKTDLEFPPIVRINGRKFITEEDAERYRQTLIRRALSGGAPLNYGA